MGYLKAARWPCDKDGECAICLQSLNKDSTDNPFVGSGPFVATVCSEQHVFHKGCIVRSAQFGNSACPSCKRPLIDVMARSGWDDFFLEAVEQGRLTEVKETTEGEEEGEEDYMRRILRSRCVDTQGSVDADESDPIRTLRFDSPEGPPFLHFRQSQLRRKTSVPRSKFYRGRSSDMRLVRIEFSDGTKRFLEGEKGAERVVSIENPNGDMSFFEGKQGTESLMRLELTNGLKVFYEGKMGAERVVRYEHPDGEEWFYEGAKGAEQLVRSRHSAGETRFYQGKKGTERIVRVELPGGGVVFYEGEQGTERKVRTEYPDGEEWFYEGKQGTERKVRTEYPDGGVVFYEGAKGAEHIVLTGQL